MTEFATIADIRSLWREMDTDETQRAVELLKVVSASLINEAKAVGKNLEEMCESDEAFALVVKSVTVDIVARTLMTSTDQEPMTQYSESVGGFSTSGTFLSPGGGMFIKKSELARLGLRRQRYGVINFYD